MWGHVVSEPVGRDVSVVGAAMIADLGARGVWEPQAMALFDTRWSTLTSSLICLIPLLLCKLQLKLRRRGSIVMTVLSVVPPLHRCAFQLIVLLVMRLLAF